MKIPSAFLLAVLLATAPCNKAYAMQERGSFGGTVSDTLGNLLADVQVGLVGTAHYSVTDEKGVFSLRDVKAGNYILSMKRLGYDPLTMTFAIADDKGVAVDFELTKSVLRLAPLTIKAERMSSTLRRVGFANRLRSGGAPPSHFITRQEIDKNHYESLQRVVDKLGGRAKACDTPALFVDGLAYQTTTDFSPATSPRAITPSSQRGPSLPSPSYSGFSRPKPLENFSIRDIEGMEIYFLSEIPAEFKRGPDGSPNDKCVVVLWTRDR
jgi:hypothetical protein